MRLILTILAGLILAVIIAVLSRPPAASPDRLVVDGVHIIDVRTGEIAEDQAILVEAGRIIEITDAERSRSASRRVDGGGRYVIPGLWDSHVHATGDVTDALDRTLPLFLAHGVTHVRDMGSNLERVADIRTGIAADAGQLAPRMLISGPIMTEVELRWYGDIQRAIGEPGEADLAVQELVEADADFAKAYTGLSAGSYAALVAAATQSGLPVDGHVPDSVGLVGVVEAGQRTIEHMDISAFLTCAGGPDGPFGNHLALRFGVGMEAHMRNLANFWQAVDWDLCAPALEGLGGRGGALVLTLSMEIRERALVPPESLASLSEASRAWCLQGLEEIDAVPDAVRQTAYGAMAEALMRIKDTGVTLLAGTDAPNHCIVPGISLAVEMERLGEAGLTPLEVLRTATLNPAQVFGGQTGIEVGQPADFVLLETNPLNDITAYRQPTGVFTQARYLDRDDLQALRDAARTTQAN